MSDLEARLDALQARLQAAEDQLAILRVLATYGPAVDSGSSQAAAELWTEDGSYDAQVGSWSGRDAIAGMVEGDTHQALIQGGCAHVLGMPLVTVDGDSAVAVCYGRFYRREPGQERFWVWRVTAIRWELVRTPAGWRVQHRVNRLLDGDPEARAMLGRAVVEAQAP